MSALPPRRDRLRAVHRRLIAWYRRNARDLPWRRTRDPYAILLSEVMLQQTQVERVRAKYHEFLAAYPTFEALSAATRADVIRRWAPLGYNRRAVRLHALARRVTERHGGRLPDTVEALRAFDGLGAYTAHAVACFAFERQVAVIDTNVRRVLGRVFADELGPPPHRPRVLGRLAGAILPVGQAYEWNQALMDLGATICTSRSPRCRACPLEQACASRGSLGALAAPTDRVAEQRATYVTAERFEGSDRYYRGRIVDRLRVLPPGASIAVEDLGHAIRPGFREELEPWLIGLIRALERDGLVTIWLADGKLSVSLP